MHAAQAYIRVSPTIRSVPGKVAEKTPSDTHRLLQFMWAGDDKNTSCLSNLFNPETYFDTAQIHRDTETDTHREGEMRLKKVSSISCVPAHAAQAYPRLIKVDYQYVQVL